MAGRAEEAVAYRRDGENSAGARDRNPSVGEANRTRRRAIPQATRVSVFSVRPSIAISLSGAGFKDAAVAGGLADIARLPFTEKNEIRASCTTENPIGSHLLRQPRGHRPASIRPAARPARRATFRSPSATSTIGSRLRRGATPLPVSCRRAIVTTYNAGPFVAGAALAAFDRLGLCHIPVGTGNTERLMTAIQTCSSPTRPC